MAGRPFRTSIASSGRRAAVIAVLFFLGPMAARDANAQDAPAVKQVVREITRTIDETVREVTADVREAVRDVASSVGRPHPQTARGGSRSEVVDRQTRPLPLGASGALDLTAIGGDITVTAGGGPPTLEIIRRVRAKSDAEGRQALARQTFTMDDRAGGVRVRVLADGATDVSFVATVPAGTGLHLVTIGGDIVVTGVRGDISARTTGGDIRLTGVGNIGLASTVGGTITIADSQGAGEANLHSISGDVRLTRVTLNQLNLDSVNGDVTATSMTCHQVNISTSSGDVVYRGILARDGHYDLHTHNGDVHFEPTTAVGFELDARTFSGTITVSPALGLHRTGRTGRVVTGISGDGAAAVVIGTFGGDVTIGGSRRD